MTTHAAISTPPLLRGLPQAPHLMTEKERAALDAATPSVEAMEDLILEAYNSMQSDGEHIFLPLAVVSKLHEVAQLVKHVEFVEEDGVDNQLENAAIMGAPVGKTAPLGTGKEKVSNQVASHGSPGATKTPAEGPLDDEEDDDEEDEEDEEEDDDSTDDDDEVMADATPLTIEIGKPRTRSPASTPSAARSRNTSDSDYEQQPTLSPSPAKTTTTPGHEPTRGTLRRQSPPATRSLMQKTRLDPSSMDTLRASPSMVTSPTLTSNSHEPLQLEHLATETTPSMDTAQDRFDDPLREDEPMVAHDTRPRRALSYADNHEDGHVPTRGMGAAAHHHNHRESPAVSRALQSTKGPEQPLGPRSRGMTLTPPRPVTIRGSQIRDSREETPHSSTTKLSAPSRERILRPSPGRSSLVPPKTVTFRRDQIRESDDDTHPVPRSTSRERARAALNASRGTTPTKTVSFRGDLAREPRHTSPALARERGASGRYENQRLSPPATGVSHRDPTRITRQDMGVVSRSKTLTTDTRGRVASTRMESTPASRLRQTEMRRRTTPSPPTTSRSPSRQPGARQPTAPSSRQTPVVTRARAAENGSNRAPTPYEARKEAAMKAREERAIREEQARELARRQREISRRKLEDAQQQELAAKRERVQRMKLQKEQRRAVSRPTGTR